LAPKNNRMIYLQSFSYRVILRILAACLIALAGAGAISLAQDSRSPGTGRAGGDSADRSRQIAEHLFDEAISQVCRLDSVSADLVQTVEMLNQTFTIEGHFLKAPGSRIYLELALAGAGRTNFTTLQVCDGETLWDFQKIADSRVFTRLSLKPILERLTAPDLEPKTRDTAIAQIGLAGVDSLLAGLRSHYKFDRIDAEASVVDDQPVWVVHGNWTSTRGLLPADSRPDSPQRLLPPYIPGEATVYLGKADYWPHKVILAGTQPAVAMDTRRRGLNGEPIGARSSIIKLEPTRIVLTYSNVQRPAAIPDDRFRAPTPRGTAAEDRTKSIIDAIDQAPRIQDGKKKGETSREDKPLVLPPIDIELPAGVGSDFPRPQ
jgi:outer membrane lipoprotein-sorting protein